jgi:disks large protein 1
LGGFGLGKRANIPPVSGGSSLLGRSHHAPKVGIKKSEVLELSSARKCSITLDGSSKKAVGSYQSGGHGAHSMKESSDISSGLSMELGSLSMELGSLSMELGSLSMELGSLSMELGSLSMEIGSLSMELGSPSSSVALSQAS